jgi:hypothetical protein
MNEHTATESKTDALVGVGAEKCFDRRTLLGVSRSSSSPAVRPDLDTCLSRIASTSYAALHNRSYNQVLKPLVHIQDIGRRFAELNRQIHQLEPYVIFRKHMATAYSNRQKIQKRHSELWPLFRLEKTRFSSLNSAQPLLTEISSR